MESRLDADSLAGVLNALLNQRPEAVLAALAEDGSMVALPKVQRFAGHPLIPVPADRANMLALVVPADRMIVLANWERARHVGVARRVVRLLDAPDRPITLVFIDARLEYGVWLAVLVAEDSTEGPDAGEVVIASLDSHRSRTATLTKNLYASITAIDDRVSRMLGFTAEDMIGQRSLNFLHPDDHERAIANWLEMNPAQPTARARVRHRTKDGSWLWVEVEHTYHYDDDPDAIFVVAQLSDISDEMAAHEAIDQREKLFRRLAESLPIGLFQVHTDRSVVYANDRLSRILGVPPVTTLEEQLATVVETDRPMLDIAFDAVLSEGIDQQLEVAIRLPDQGRRAETTRRRVAVTLAALSDQEGAPGAIVTVSDVTDAARMREELKHRATFDDLTGCYNRGSTMSLLEHALAADEGPLAVVFVDLDDFKPVNDELGHAAGDEILVHAASQLTALLRSQDAVGRIGGDEFLLICRGVRSIPEAQALAGRIERALNVDVAVTGGMVKMRASIGVALSAAAALPGDLLEASDPSSPQEQLAADSLVAMADVAMYESKRMGTGTAVLYTSALDPEMP